MTRILISFIALALLAFHGFAQVAPPRAPTSKELSACRSAAAKGHADAMYRLGSYYYFGKGLKKNPATARTWLVKSANKKNVDAMLLLAEMYEDGSGVKKDPEQALNWTKKAAENGNTEAAFELGSRYETGEGVPVSMPDAVKWYNMAADSGNVDAMINLGFCYTTGDGVPAEKVTGIRWFESATKAGSVEAMRFLGDYYAEADMGDDCEKALDWYMKAGSHNDTAAVRQVGTIVMMGQCPHIDTETVVRWMYDVAKKSMPQACFYMGGFYIEGIGVRRNPVRGMDMLIKNHELGHYTGMERNLSTNNLFTLYNSGALDAGSKAKLLQWFERTAVKTADDEMMAVIANIYINREAASGNDYRAGLDWAMKSADKGNPGGCFWVGFVYAKGLGDIKQNDAKAFSWILKAAQKGDKDAMKMLADFYRFGTGTVADQQKAEEWTAKAARED